MNHGISNNFVNAYTQQNVFADGNGKEMSARDKTPDAIHAPLEEAPTAHAISEAEVLSSHQQLRVFDALLALCRLRDGERAAGSLLTAYLWR